MSTIQGKITALANYVVMKLWPKVCDILGGLEVQVLIEIFDIWENFRTGTISAKVKTMNPEEYIKYLPEFKVVICLACKYSLHSRENVTLHFRRCHRTIELNDRKAIADYIDNLALVEEATDIQLPVDPVEAIPELPIYTDGWKCNECKYFTHKKRAMENHCRDTHGGISSRIPTYY
jgi:hypothetical protein